LSTIFGTDTDRSFAGLPRRIAALTGEHERVAVVLLDAFGWEFVQRHADHPFLRRLQIEPVDSQFPSTTTAHVTTLYTGLPVEQHGLYEWHVYEPRLDRIIVPLPFVGAEGLDPRELVPGPTFFERLEVPSFVLQQSTIWPSKYGSAAFAGAEVRAFERLDEAAAQLGTRPGLTYVYWDRIDAVGHRHGPASERFDQEARAALDALEAVRDTLIVVTADHGQIGVGEIDYLDELWPPLLDHLRYEMPAGSARDCFLHVRDPETVVGELSAVLGERAEVRPARELFPHAGPRLLERLADVCVLPAPGRMAWLRSHPSHQLSFKGHHGGRTPEEARTWVGIG
jgi:predicted AlkP superfamily pyrophosphatase or phosphodiesterase